MNEKQWAKVEVALSIPFAAGAGFYFVFTYALPVVESSPYPRFYGLVMMVMLDLIMFGAASIVADFIHRTRMAVFSDSQKNANKGG